MILKKKGRRDRKRGAKMWKETEKREKVTECE